MIQFNLPGNLTLLLEPANKKFRLVLIDGTQELACRKETRTNLKRFITSTESQLFKGRLQLYKNDDAIIIKLKGEDVGAITLSELEKALET
ncbi:hypothetical protein [Mucilaginibacter gilvus]|uniref:Uncharacterized protein n=1 Tax=Mucilaginibacter gilvus TaxID=2305909 RepID=A0A444MUA6_9SPHI|nr:hypothetical protein [Mucilaginibacter gilvus]RWY57212.1 hypothetical protein EPL05_01370 [Mucilaginibacter gilvus]